MSTEERFDEPKITINRVYTRQGDQGKTRLVGGQSVSKTDLRLHCYGSLDELNSVVGVARTAVRATPTTLFSSSRDP